MAPVARGGSTAVQTPDRVAGTDRSRRSGRAVDVPALVAAARDGDARSAGDGIQAAKGGILEVADVFVVNKADRDGADQTVRDLRCMLTLGGRHSDAGRWRPFCAPAPVP